MLVFGKLRDFARSFELLEDAQGHQCDDSLAVRWVLPYFDALVRLVTVRAVTLLRSYALTGKFKRDGIVFLTAQF